jgi:arsenate reductase-like glutaredoxin family protein
MIVIYTKSHCAKCDDIKGRMKDAGVEFTEQSSEAPAVLKVLIEKLKNAGLKNPILPVLEFDDGALVSNDMGLYRELKQRKIL